MAKISYDILVDDDNVNDIKKLNSKLSKDFESALLKYINSLKRLSEEGFIEGLVADNVKSLYNQVSLLEDEVNTIKNNENKELDSFLEKMDEADSVLY